MIILEMVTLILSERQLQIISSVRMNQVQSLLKAKLYLLPPTFHEKNGDSMPSHGVRPDVYWKRSKKRQNHSPCTPLSKSIPPIILEGALAKDGQDAKSSTKDSIIQNKE
ncbi:hypothetical protein SLE2022_144380 [Rubroshorea leprosula]